MLIICIFKKFKKASGSTIVSQNLAQTQDAIPPVHTKNKRRPASRPIVSGLRFYHNSLDTTIIAFKINIALYYQPVDMENSDNVIEKLSFVDRYLSLWIILVMIFGVITGYYSESATEALNSVKILDVGLPVAIGLWLMMWPVLVKVRYEKLGAIMSMKGTTFQLVFSMMSNWVVGPFLMLACAWICLPDLSSLRNGVIMVGLARCIAMVLIWNDLARGDPEYCAILVAFNSILQILLYAPMAYFFLVVISNQYTGSGEYNLQFLSVFYSVLIFLGIPLVMALLSRIVVKGIRGTEWLESVFCPIALLALLWTTFAIFVIQGKNIVDNIGNVCRVAVPMVMYFCIMFTSSLFLCRYYQFGYEKSITQAFTASSNNFELAIAVSAATIGVSLCSWIVRSGRP